MEKELNFLKKNDFKISKYIILFSKPEVSLIFILKNITNELKKLRINFQINFINEEYEIEQYFLDINSFFEKSYFVFIGFGNMSPLFEKLVGILKFSHIYVIDNSFNFSLLSQPLEKNLFFRKKNFSNFFFLKKLIDRGKKEENFRIFYLPFFPSQRGVLPFFLKLKNDDFFDKVWLESLGTTTLFLSKKINKKKYKGEIFFLKQIFLEFLNEKIRKNNTRFFSNRFSMENNLNYKEKELQVDLLKHWTVLQSFIHSPLFAIKMKIWQKAGIRTLSGFFFRMGFSLDQLKQKWANLDLNFKKKLEKSLKLECENLGMDSENLSCFIRVYEDKRKESVNFEFSTFDFILAISSISDIKLKEFEKKKIKKKFMKTYDAIFDLRKINIGIQSAKNAKKLVTKISGFILNKKTFLTEKYFRYIHLHENKGMSLNILKDIVFFLNGAFIESGFKKKGVFLFVHRGRLTFVLGFFTCKILKKIILNKLNFIKKYIPNILLIEEDFFFAFHIPKEIILGFLRIIKKI